MKKCKDEEICGEFIEENKKFCDERKVQAAEEGKVYSCAVIDTLQEMKEKFSIVGLKLMPREIKKGFRDGQFLKIFKNSSSMHKNFCLIPDSR